MSGQISSDSICSLKARLCKTQITEKICPVSYLLLLSWIIDTSRKRIKPGHSDTLLYLTKSLTTTLLFSKTTGSEGPCTKGKSFAVVQLACRRERGVSAGMSSLFIRRRCPSAIVSMFVSPFHWAKSWNAIKSSSCSKSHRVSWKLNKKLNGRKQRVLANKLKVEI